MIVQRIFAVLVVAFLLWLAVAISTARAFTVPPGPDGEPVPLPPPSSPSPPRPGGNPAQTLEIAALKAKVEREHARLLHARALLRRRWTPTVDYAIRLASAATGVSSRELYAVARCESTLNPFASNGRYQGLFQLGWAPFGFSPFDPVANALSAAMTVQRDGGWREWQCRP